MENNTSFDGKQHVVLKDTFQHSQCRADFTDFSFIPSLPRARITGVLHFLLSQVSHYPPSPLTFRILRIYQKHRLCFTLSTTTKRSNSGDEKHPQKTSFLCVSERHCDTCDSKKIKLLLEGAHARVREGGICS